MIVISEILGGLGNQLFSYCLGYLVSQHVNSELYIDTSRNDFGIDRELEILNLNVPFDKRISYSISKKIIDRAVFNKIRRRMAVGFGTRYYREKRIHEYDPNVFKINKDTWFRGYWQNSKYYLPYRKHLNNVIKFKNNPDRKYVDMIEQIKNNNQSIAIHIRRGDYLNFNGLSLPMEYYDIAINRVIVNMENPQIYIFSDDLEYCKDYFTRSFSHINIVYPTYFYNNRTIDDLRLMSMFKNIIIANSTYSWWAAFLGDEKKRVICPDYRLSTGDYNVIDWEKIKV